MKNVQRIVGFVAAAVMLFAIMPMSAFASVSFDDANQIIDVQMPVTYGQSEARTMLAYINNFRTGTTDGKGNHEAHPHAALGTDNQTWVDYPNLQPLKYDYELEQVAMQRAAEIALTFSHDRPDGTNSLDTAFPASFSSGTIGENIVAGTDTAWSAFLLWREDDESYAGQGHRRNMLNTSFRSVGIGHAVCDGVHFWVQEFSSLEPTVPETAPNDFQTEVPIQIKSGNVDAATSSINPEVASLDLTAGSNATAPRARFLAFLSGALSATPRLTYISPEWTVEDPLVAEYAGGKITGLKPGMTQLKATVFGETLSIPVNVTCRHQAGANWLNDPDNHWHQCAICGEMLDFAPHTFTEWQETTAPTCTETGEHTRTCSVCGYSTTETLPPIGHKFGKWTVVTNAECEKEGLESRTCANCGTVETQPIAALEHNYEQTVTAPPTCTTDGVATFTCSHCGKSYTEPIAALGHNLLHHPAVNASCTEAGSPEYWSCDRCGKNFADKDSNTEFTNEQLVIPALSHHLTHHDRVPATCTQNGTVEYWSCDKCGKNFADKDGKTVLTDLVEKALGHQWDKWKSVTSPTCTAAGTEFHTCTVCGRVETREVPALGHHMTHHDRVPATCIKNGIVEYWSCDRCGKNFADKNGKTSITDLVEKAVGHTWGEWKTTTKPTCTEKGIETRTCTSCGESQIREIKALGHSLAHVDAVQPTEQQSGCVEHWHCQNCGKNFADQNTGKELSDVVLQPVPASSNPAKPTETPYDWQTARAAIAGIHRGVYQKDVGHEIAVPHYVWQAFYGRDVTVTFVRGGDKYVFNGLDLQKTGFDPDNGHNLTDLTAYINRSYTPAPAKPQPQQTPAPKPTEEPAESQKPAQSEPEKTPIPTASPSPSPSFSEAEETNAQPTENEKDSSGLVWWVWLIVAAVALLIIGGIVVLVKRRNPED